MKNESIELLHEMIKQAKNRAAKELGKYKNRLQELYNKQFDDWKELQDALKALEASEKYGTNEYGEIYAWVRFDEEVSEDEKEYLDTYVQEHGFSIDFKNEALMSFQGECIGIDEDGDVFDGRKCIIERREYKTDDERNELIEKYMERTGCFPGVFEISRYGDVRLVRTQK